MAPKRNAGRSGSAQEMFGRLSCGLGRRDSKADVAVGQSIAGRKSRREIDALVELLSDRKAASSAVKALYECGYLEPSLLVPHVDAFGRLVVGKNNRLVWGGMIALSCAAQSAPDAVWPLRKQIMQAFETGSVITRDAAVIAMSRLASSKAPRSRALGPWLVDALQGCRLQDLPSFAEQIIPALTKTARTAAIAVARQRGESIERDAPRRRLARLLREHAS